MLGFLTSPLENMNHDVVKDYGTDGEKDVFMPLHLGSEDKLQVISLHGGIWRLN